MARLDELRALMARHARADWGSEIDGVMISHSDHPTPPTASMTGTVLAVMAQGRKTLALGDKVFDYQAGQFLICSVDMPITGRFTVASPDEPALSFGLQLEPAEIAELLLRAGLADLPPCTKGPLPGLAVSEAPDELLDAVVRLLRLLDHPRDREVLLPLVKREILWRLITGEQGAIVRQLGLADSSLNQVSRAVRWIRDHYRESFKVQDLASTSGLSVSAFHRNFHAVTAMSPIQFQKQIRLQEARLLLATQPNDVTRISFAVGYDSPSQFSREYRRQFGTAPSQDAAQLRS
ncbi:AraC family transcriptional regulator [Streptomyces sp. SID13031]|uniref:AraC family transcriptional regulator n=1 Tax=Streptomyces sp. SID13031 TaxID=2706046 RepID=UPI0013CA1961|nr:AraC family transcriptional regulator [Streptomyces sp. SID13031]NEA36553.1 AraC family transcriptional regulator [Streptomyces sp. SID13031]